MRIKKEIPSSLKESYLGYQFHKNLPFVIVLAGILAAICGVMILLDGLFDIILEVLVRHFIILILLFGVSLFLRYQKNIVPPRINRLFLRVVAIELLAFGIEIGISTWPFMNFTIIYILMIFAVATFLHLAFIEQIVFLSTSFVIFNLLLVLRRAPFFETIPIMLQTLTCLLVGIAFAKIILNMNRRVFLDQQRIRDQNRDLELNNKRLQALINMDMMTGLLNHTSILKTLNDMMHESRENNRPLSIIMADIDHFKKINDRHGHQIGDKVIVRLANVITACLGRYDYAGRYGGEEFLIVLGDSDIKEALAFTEVLKEKIAEIEVSCEKAITISGGVSQLGEERLNELIYRTDMKLYLAKESGRNRFVSEEVDLTEA